MDTWFFLFILCIIVFWSIWLRVYRLRQIAESAEIKASPLSLAIQELISLAAGVYLSLIMLISFLKLDMPAKITVLQISIDPVACTAIGLAIIQPIVLKLFNKK